MLHILHCKQSIAILDITIDRDADQGLTAYDGILPISTGWSGTQLDLHSMTRFICVHDVLVSCTASDVVIRLRQSRVILFAWGLELFKTPIIPINKE